MSVFLTLCACASNFAVYESPTSGKLSNISFVNTADNQAASFATFDDGKTCSRRRHIQFKNADTIPPGKSGSTTAAAGSEFVLFTSLGRIESDDYEIEIGMTGGGPGPLRRRTVTAIGCTAILSINVEPDTDYRVEISEAVTAGSCSIAVSEINEEGDLLAIEPVQRISRAPRDELGSFCEPLKH